MRSTSTASRVVLVALVGGLCALGFLQLKERFWPAEFVAEFVPFGVPAGERTRVGASLERPDFSGEISKEEKALYERAFLLRGTGDPAGSRAILNGLLAMHPKEPALLAFSAVLALDRAGGGNDAALSAAEIAVDGALSEGGESPDPRLSAAKVRLLLRRGAAAEAALWGERLAARAGGSAEARMLQARALLAAHRPDSAVRAAAWAVTLSPAQARGAAYALLAEAHHQAGRLDSARAVCDFALSLFPMERDLLLLRARLHEYDSDLDAARAVYSRLVGLYPTDPEVSQAFATIGQKRPPSVERLASCGNDLRTVLDELSERYRNDAEISGLLFELRSRLGLDEYVASAGVEAVQAEGDAELAELVQKGVQDASESGLDRFGHFRVRWGASESDFLHQVDSSLFRRLGPGVWRTERRDGGRIHIITVHLKNGYDKVQLLVADTTGRPGDLLGHTLRALTRRSGTPRATGDSNCPGLGSFQGFVWESADDFTLMAQFAQAANQVRIVRMPPEALPSPFSLCEVARGLQDWKPAGVPATRGDI